MDKKTKLFEKFMVNLKKNIDNSNPEDINDLYLFYNAINNQNKSIFVLKPSKKGGFKKSKKNKKKRKKSRKFNYY